MISILKSYFKNNQSEFDIEDKSHLALSHIFFLFVLSFWMFLLFFSTFDRYECLYRLSLGLDCVVTLQRVLVHTE